MQIQVSCSKQEPLVPWDKTKQNLEQYRAMMALKSASDIAKGNGGGKMVAKKVATQIRENGFLGALAFASEKTIKENDGENFKNKAHQSVFEAIRKYLVGIKLVSAKTTDEMREEISNGTVVELRIITAEAIAYMNYLRRFAKPDKNNAEDGD